MAGVLDAECLYLDDFVKPEALWPSRTSPSFPFAHIRYDEFLDAVKSLAQHGSCTYRPYDWDAHQVQDERRTIKRGTPVIIEGASALHPELAPLYDLRIWV
jgi:uridine kinase